MSSHQAPNYAQRSKISQNTLKRCFTVAVKLRFFFNLLKTSTVRQGGKCCLNIKHVQIGQGRFHLASYFSHNDFIQVGFLLKKSQGESVAVK